MIWRVVFKPDMTLCGRLGIKYQESGLNQAFPSQHSQQISTLEKSVLDCQGNVEELAL